MAESLAVLGLGLMGGTLAGHLMADGHDIVGFDPDPERQDDHRARGGTVAATVADAVDGLSTVLLSLPNSAIMLDVCAEIAGAVPAMATDRRPLIIDTTTGDPEDSIRAAAMLDAAGAGYVDATVSGNAAQALERDIIFMMGGTPGDTTRAKALLADLGRAVHVIGPVASGSRAKLVINHVLYVNRGAMAEGLTVAEKAGLDLSVVLDLLRDSAAYSKAMDIWGDRMVTGDHYPPNSRIRQSHKDARLINDHAEAVGGPRELVDGVRRALVEAEDGGLSDADNSALIEVMRRRVAIGRVPPQSPEVDGSD